MKLNREILLFLLIICFPILSISQGFQSVRTSNFDGVHNIMLNPASAVNNKTYIDINIGSGMIYFHNNFLHIPEKDFQLKNYLFKKFKKPLYDTTVLFQDGSPFTYYPGVTDPMVRGQIHITGPSVHFSLKRQSFSFFTAYRGAIYSDIPFDMYEVLIEGEDYLPDYNNSSILKNINTGMMLWGEAGVSYATVLNPQELDSWYIGASLKFLSGYTSAFLHNKELTYSIDKQPNIYLNGIDSEFGFSTKSKFFKPNGYGLGMDFGIHYIKRGGYSRPTEYFNKLRDQTYKDYKYKLGFSITNLGAIRYKKNSTMSIFYSDTSMFIEGLDKYEDLSIDSMQYILEERIGEEIEEIVSSALVYDKYTMTLPTKLSFQFEYHLLKNLYINSIFIKPIKTRHSHINIPAQISICPRYETKNLEIWLPVSWNEYYKTHFGAAVRFWFFTLGTENIAGFFKKSDFTGADLFLSINFPLARKKFRKHQNNNL